MCAKSSEVVASLGVAGVELASAAVRVVVGHRESGRFKVTGVGHAPIASHAVSGGYIADRHAVGAALVAAFASAERTLRADRIVVAIDGDDIRTYHETTMFEREDQRDAVSSGEAMKAVRLARDAAARMARDLAGDDPALRGIATAELRSDVGGFVLDGRRLGSPVGDRGQRLEVRTDIALAPLVQAGGAAATLESAKRRGTATSGAYALGRLVAESGVAEAGIARLGADQTTVTVVRDGRVTGTRVFAVGRDALIARHTAADAGVWAHCVVATVRSLGLEQPGRWYAGGVPEGLTDLPKALAAAASAERGSSVDVLPLRASLVPRLVADATLTADDLVAASAAALGAEAYS
jgi:cell division ATPase FtsA